VREVQREGTTEGSVEASELPALWAETALLVGELREDVFNEGKDQVVGKLVGVGAVYFEMDTEVVAASEVVAPVERPEETFQLRVVRLQ